MTLTERGHVSEEGQIHTPGHLFEQSVRVEDPALADGEQEEDGDDAEGSLHLGSHRPSDHRDNGGDISEELLIVFCWPRRVASRLSPH